MDDVTRRKAMQAAVAGIVAAVGVAATAAAGEPRPAAQIGTCKRPGCKCPGYAGGYRCSNCGHSDVDHI